MAAYGYDGRHLFKFDKVIRYQGETSSPPTEDVNLVGDEEMAARFTGSYFLSGRRDPAFNVWVDGDKTSFVMTYWKDGSIQHGYLKDPGMVSHLVPICLNGPIIRQADKLAAFCDNFPSSTIFVCPIDFELAALGALVKEMPPRRAFIPEKNTDDLPYEAQEFDPKLEDDCFGRMAALVKNGHAVLNQVYKGPGGFPFYGHILSAESHPEVEMFMVRSGSVVDYFPDAPISAKFHAATTRPVMMTPSRRFRKETNCKQKKVSVIVASDFLNGSSTFMRFYQLGTGRDWVSICLKELIKPLQTIPVVRYNKAYRIPVDDYIKMG